MFNKHRNKKEKESKKAQHQVRIKEIKIRPNIDTHDLNTKMNRAKEFILKGNKVRITCMFRGREMLHTDLGEKLIQKILDELEDIAILEAPIKLVGRNLSCSITPLGKSAKKKTKENNSAEDENKQIG